MMRIAGLYAITPETEDTVTLVERVDQALAGGTRVFQYRNKRASPALRREQIMRLLPRTRSSGAVLIVNDDVDLAVECDADGAHIGSTDGSPGQARTRLGNGKILGVSCYNRIELASAALDCGADYIAFGSVFASLTKPNAVPAPLTLIQAARARHPRAVIVAIGGITRENAASVFEAGADAVAVISDLFDTGDIAGAARTFTAIHGAGANFRDL